MVNTHICRWKYYHASEMGGNHPALIPHGDRGFIVLQELWVPSGTEMTISGSIEREVGEWRDLPIE